MRSLLVVTLLAACGHDVSLGGPNTLVRVDPLAPGIECGGGGVKINTGLDRDGDTYLDDDEITSVQVVCNGEKAVQCAGGVVHEGTLSIRADEDTSALSGVNCVDGNLLLADLSVDSLAFADALEIVTGDVVVAGNANLRTLDGLELRAVGGNVVVQGNDALVNVGALAALDRAASLRIVGNEGLLDLAGLETVTELRTDVIISNNTNLATLAGLDNVTVSKRSLMIRSNRNLTSVAALGALRSTAMLEISGNTNLATVALPSLENVDVRLLVTNNPLADSLAFPLLATVGDAARFDGSANARRIDLPTLLTAGGVYVNNATALQELSAPSLLYITVGLDLVNLPNLSRVELGALTSVGANVQISNVGLTSFAGLDALGLVGGTMTVGSCSGIRSFQGLGALEVVAGDLTIQSNGNLSSFEGLGGFREVGEDLTISGNASLARATATAFANSITVRGQTTIN